MKNKFTKSKDKKQFNFSNKAENQRLKSSSVFFDGLIKNNPTFVLLLGMCPTLATTTSAITAFGMGISAMAVLIFSNLTISFVRKVIPNKIRIAAFITIIAGFVSLVEMLLKAFVPALADSLGIFIPLIVVNCIILARAEGFASKHNPFKSIIDGFGTGLGFTVALVIIGGTREILGSGSIFGFSLYNPAYAASLFTLPAGGFLTLGIILGVINFAKERKHV